MPTPHDYYDIHGMPRLHNVGEGRPYLENDYHANDHGPQVPSLSTIGRGPRGEGLKVVNVVNENNTVSFALYSDLTGELVWQSPNLGFLPDGLPRSHRRPTCAHGHRAYPGRCDQDDNGIPALR